MFIIIGLIIVFASVFGSYTLGGGALGPLYQPLELLAIGGATVGAFIAGNNGKAMKATFASIGNLKISTTYSKQTYADVMVVLFSILTKSRREGMMAIESDIENPAESPLFIDYPNLLKDKATMEFITDYMRLMVLGNMDAHEMDELMEREIEGLEHESALPESTLQAAADGLPAFGIVAAVMGVVKALTYADASPAEIGEMIAHALVGTFLGILLAYGLAAPLATRVRRQVDEQVKMLSFIRVILVNSLNGYQPQVAVEFGRKILHKVERPTAIELEEVLRESKRSAKGKE